MLKRFLKYYSTQFLHDKETIKPTYENGHKEFLERDNLNYPENKFHNESFLLQKQRKVFTSVFYF